MEAWIRILEDETRYARQHETLRANASYLVVIITGAVLGVVTFDGSVLESRADIASVLGLFVIAINVLGIFTSLKHYERARRHQRIAGAIRKVLSDEHPIRGKTLGTVRGEAKDRHKCRFPVFAKRFRLHILWVWIHVALAFGVGVGLPLLTLM